jgi:prepilin signal peptidase PulO-like enzyme (type II secretory pathway)
MWGYALLGLLVGAVLNHAANTLPERRSVVQAPRCASCSREHSPLEWIALLALILGRRRCPQCAKTLAWRAPLVELGTALLFAYLWSRYGPSAQLALFTLYSCIFILVLLTDLEHRLVLNVVMLPAILFAIVSAFFRPDMRYGLALFGGLFGFLLVFLIYLAGPLFVRVWSRMRGQTTTEVPFGFGDVTLSTFIGLVVGFPAVGFALAIGFFLGGIGAVAFILARVVLQRRYVALTAIPYGPFLIAGGMIMMLNGPAIVEAYTSSYR